MALVRDIAGRKAAEQHMHLLLSEMNQRSKNMLTVAAH